MSVSPARVYSISASTPPVTIFTADSSSPVACDSHSATPETRAAWSVPTALVSSSLIEPLMTRI
jgi:hypothetical protein